jgi:hypothetical protein
LLIFFVHCLAQPLLIFFMHYFAQSLLIFFLYCFAQSLLIFFLHSFAQSVDLIVLVIVIMKYHFINLVLLVHFLQMLYEVHELLCYEENIDETTHQILRINAKSTSKENFQTLLNFVVLHEYQMSLVYDLMLNKELKIVKARSMT